MLTTLSPTGKEDGEIDDVMYPKKMKCKVAQLFNDKHLSSSNEKLTLFKTMLPCIEC